MRSSEALPVISKTDVNNILDEEERREDRREGLVGPDNTLLDGLSKKR